MNRIHTNRLRNRSARILFVAMLLPATSLAQDKPTLEELNPFQDPQAVDQQSELEKLFATVERNLFRIDTYLLDASAGDTSKLKEVDASGIDEILSCAFFFAYCKRYDFHIFSCRSRHYFIPYGTPFPII